MTTLVRWQPYRGMATLSNVMDRMFNQSYWRPADLIAPYWNSSQAMPVDVTENADGYTVKASMPGWKPEEINVNIENDVLTIRAERKVQDERQDGDEIRWQERYAGTLERRFTLPIQIDANKVEAKLEHGVLTLSLPKAEAVKPKTIQIQAK